MRKITALAGFLMIVVSAQADGQKVFDEKCASCHMKEATVAHVKKNYKTMLAPPMVEISGKLKANIKITSGEDDVHKAVVVAFVKDYVINPTIFHSMCDAFPLEHFGVMPSMKGKITQQELDEVSEWVYDYFEGKKFE